MKVNFGHPSAGGTRRFTLDLLTAGVPSEKSPWMSDGQPRPMVVTAEACRACGETLIGQAIRVVPQLDDHFEDERWAAALGAITDAELVAKADGEHFVVSGNTWNKQDPELLEYLAAHTPELGGSIELSVLASHDGPNGELVVDKFDGTGAAVLKRTAAAFGSMTRFLWASATPLARAMQIAARAAALPLSDGDEDAWTADQAQVASELCLAYATEGGALRPELAGPLFAHQGGSGLAASDYKFPVATVTAGRPGVAMGGLKRAAAALCAGCPDGLDEGERTAAMGRVQSHLARFGPAAGPAFGMSGSEPPAREAAAANGGGMDPKEFVEAIAAANAKVDLLQGQVAAAGQALTERQELDAKLMAAAGAPSLAEVLAKLMALDASVDAFEEAGELAAKALADEQSAHGATQAKLAAMSEQVVAAKAAQLVAALGELAAADVPVATEIAALKAAGKTLTDAQDERWVEFRVAASVAAREAGPPARASLPAVTVAAAAVVEPGMSPRTRAAKQANEEAAAAAKLGELWSIAKIRDRERDLLDQNGGV
jgi:hypothetical protein